MEPMSAQARVTSAELGGDFACHAEGQGSPFGAPPMGTVVAGPPGRDAPGGAWRTSIAGLGGRDAAPAPLDLEPHRLSVYWLRFLRLARFVIVAGVIVEPSQHVALGVEGFELAPVRTDCTLAERPAPRRFRDRDDGLAVHANVCGFRQSSEPSAD